MASFAHASDRPRGGPPTSRSGKTMPNAASHIATLALVLPWMGTHAPVARAPAGMTIAATPAAHRVESNIDNDDPAPNDDSEEPERHGSHSEYHENGKKKLHAHYKHGRLDGRYVAFHENGRKKLETHYRSGIQHGQRTEFSESGKKLSSTTWIEGAHASPKSIKEIEVALHDLLPTTPTDGSIAMQRADTVRWIKAYRYLCDLPYADITLDDDRNAKALAATKLFGEIGSMSHTPWNPGWPNDRFEEAKVGAQECNLHYWPDKTTPARMVQSHIWDSDRSNQQTLNHRRWLLSPRYQQLGVGFHNAFGAIWARDFSREDDPIPWVAFPPPGPMPIDLFSHRQEEGLPYVWSVFLDKRFFDDPQQEDVQIEVRAVDRELTLGKALPIDLFEIVREHVPGVEHSILFQPRGIERKRGARYFVRLHGLTHRGDEKDIRYVVSFFVRRKKP